MLHESYCHLLSVTAAEILRHFYFAFASTDFTQPGRISSVGKEMVSDMRDGLSRTRTLLNSIRGFSHCHGESPFIVRINSLIFRKLRLNVKSRWGFQQGLFFNTLRIEMRKCRRSCNRSFQRKHDKPEVFIYWEKRTKPKQEIDQETKLIWDRWKSYYWKYSNRVAKEEFEGKSKWHAVDFLWLELKISYFHNDTEN